MCSMYRHGSDEHCVEAAVLLNSCCINLSYLMEAQQVQIQFSLMIPSWLMLIGVAAS